MKTTDIILLGVAGIGAYYLFSKKNITIQPIPDFTIKPPTITIPGLTNFFTPTPEGVCPTIYTPGVAGDLEQAKQLALQYLPGFKWAYNLIGGS